MVIAADTKAVLLSAGIMFLVALLLGVVKYRQMAASSEGRAHPYIDTAHRAALLYSFAILLVATFVELSGFSEAVDLVAAAALVIYFFAAVMGYTVHGLLRDTDNQFRDGGIPGIHAFMWTLIVAEIGGWTVLLAGFVDGQL